MNNTTAWHPPVRPRPARAVAGGVIAVGLVAGVVAFAAHQWFYVIVLYGFLIGMCGGLMAWMVLDAFDPELQGTRIMAIAGLATATATYLLYEYLRYRFEVIGIDPRPLWWDHLQETAQAGASFGRLGRNSTIDLGPVFVWAARALDLAIAMCCGWGIARTVNLRH